MAFSFAQVTLRRVDATVAEWPVEFESMLQVVQEDVVSCNLLGFGISLRFQQLEFSAPEIGEPLPLAAKAYVFKFDR